MSDRTQDIKNLRAVATACKNYTDSEIAKSEERMKWYIGEYTTTTSDDNTSASTKTVPSNATRCKIKRIYGLTQKFNPTTAYDDTSYMIKTMPATVYDFDVSKVEGASEVSENLINVANSLIGYSINSTTGEPFASSQNYCSSVFINVIPNTQYTISFINNVNDLRISEYSTNDASGHIQRTSTTNASSYTFTTTVTTNYIKWSFNYNNSTATQEILNSLQLMLNIGSTALPYEPYYTDIHNFAWNGVKVEGANKCSAVSQNPTNMWEASFTFNAQPNTTYYFKTRILATNYNVRLRKEGIGNVETYYSNYDTNNGIGFSFTTGNIEAGEYILVTQFATQKSYQEELSVIQPMLNEGSTALAYVPYITPTTKTIDLSTILYNGSPLFEGNSLKGVGTAKDYITPYLAHKGMGYIDLGSLDYSINNSNFPSVFVSTDLASLIKPNMPNVKANIKCANYTVETRNDMVQGQIDKSISIGAYNVEGTSLYICDGTYSGNPTALKTALSGVYLVYELATPIEVSIDWSSTLRGITGYSNGTITLQNTYNMDTANIITYNSILKENCCAKIVQSRGGNVVKTINLPTTASDGYSAGSVYNVRDLTTSKRGTNVNRVKAKDSTWTYQSSIFKAVVSGIKSTNFSSIGNILCNLYTTVSFSNISSNDKSICITNTSPVETRIRDTSYTDATTFTNHFTNDDYIYYELADASKTETSIDAVDNIIEVQAGDELAFYDANDNLVTVPSDLTYRIEVAN